MIGENEIDKRLHVHLSETFGPPGTAERYEKNQRKCQQMLFLVEHISSQIIRTDIRMNMKNNIGYGGNLYCQGKPSFASRNFDKDDAMSRLCPVYFREKNVLQAPEKGACKRYMDVPPFSSTYLQLQKSRKMRGFQNFVLKTDPEKTPRMEFFKATCYVLWHLFFPRFMPSGRCFPRKKEL
jgi:hypothetical protein